jgi:hypothetical protein
VRIDLQVDTSPLLLRLKNGERRLAYAVVNAIKNTALRIQEAERDRVRRKFVVRKSDFIMREAAIIKPFPSVSQSRPYAEISVGQKQRLLLAKYEQGAAREPFTPGAKSVAVPLLGRPARRSIASAVPPAFRFSGMKLKAFYKGKRLTKRRRGGHVDSVDLHGEYGRVSLPQPEASGGVQWKGENRTFLLPVSERAPFGAVFQRIGPGRGDIREIWSFKRGVRLDTRLEFVVTAQRVAAEWFGEELERETIAALARSGAAS